MTGPTGLACAVLGLPIGSFLNVVIARAPRGESVVRPPSHCPGCGARIAARDNVPVLSWLLLGGHCRSCDMRISPRYPLVELGTAVAFGAAGAALGPHWSLPPVLALTATLLATGVIALDRGAPVGR